MSRQHKATAAVLDDRLSGRADIIATIRKCAITHARSRAPMGEGSMDFWFNQFKEEVVWTLWDSDPGFVGGVLTKSEWLAVRSFYSRAFAEQGARRRRRPRRSKRS